MSEHQTPLLALNRIPENVYCAQDYESLAKQFITWPNHEYIAGGNGKESTLQANLAAFDALTIRPRLLRDVTSGHTNLHLLGRDLRHPILLAPVAFQKLVHVRGELETAHAAAAMDTCMVCSTLSSFRLEDIAQIAGQEKWFQLYFQPQREHTLDLIRRAESAGFTALVVTLDASIQSPSIRSRRTDFSMPPDMRPANLEAYPLPQQVSLPPDQSVIFQGMMTEAPVWADLEWLLDQTTLPVLVKGVLHAADASLLQRMGVAGLVVSNHGGRVLDGMPASLEVLPEIRQAVGTGYPLLLDSGIRSGSDVFKALALGADAVMIGRLQVYALSVAGAMGVAHLIRLLRDELEVCMALTGCSSLTEISNEMVR